MTRNPSPGALTFIGLALWATGLRAQSVSGVVRGEPGGAHVAGAVVILTAADGVRLKGTLTDEAGRFRLVAPAAGRYSLRVDVVGYRSTTIEPFALDTGAELSRDVTFRFERIALPAVAVTASSRCSAVSGEEGVGEAARLWNEARKALEASRLAVEERRFSVTFRRYDRTIGLPDSVVRASRSWTETGVTSDPFESLHPDSVARTGFSVQRDSARYYYAPDAAVLLSDSFVAGHCFGTRRGGPDGAVGLSFRPQRASGIVDIDGVLWLDSASAELRSLEYRYVPSIGRGIAGGGMVSFGRYPTGVWGVRRWAIRLPVLQVVESRRRPDGALGRFVDTLVTSIREEGGEAITGVAARGPETRLTGTVFDSTMGAPLAGAVVTVEGFARTAVTDSVGQFSIDTLPDGGEARLRLSHARLDSLGIAAPTMAVRIRRGVETPVHFAVSGVASVARIRCRSTAWGAQRIITGQLRPLGDSASLPADAEVIVLERRGDTGALVRHVEAPNDAGRFAFCGVQPGAQAWLVARSGSVWSAPQFVGGDGAAPVTLVAMQVPGGPAAAQVPADSGLQAGEQSAPAGSAAVLLGRTLDPGGSTAVEGWIMRNDDAADAQVLVNNAVRATVTSDGSFRVQLRPGAAALTFRSPLLAPLRVALSLDSGQTQLLFVSLRTGALTVVDQRPATRDAGLAGFEQRKRSGNGAFFDRAAIEARNARTLADILRTVPGVRIQVGNGGNRYVSTRFRRMGPPSGIDDGGSCDMMIYLDGQPFLMEPGTADLRIRVAEIQAIEVYASASSVPRQFAGANAACGVIVIWRG